MQDPGKSWLDKFIIRHFVWLEVGPSSVREEREGHFVAIDRYKMHWAPFMKRWFPRRVSRIEKRFGVEYKAKLARSYGYYRRKLAS